MISQKMVQKLFLKCWISNKLDGTEDMMYSKRIATKWKMKTVMKQQKVEIKIKMKKCLMTIMSNIHWGTENISLGNLRTRTMVRMNLKYSEALFNLCKFFFFSFRLFPSIRGGHSISSSSKPLCSTSVFFAPTSSISSFTTSTNLLFGLVLLLFPGNSISIIFLPTYSWSLLMTCPYHLSLPSLIFIPNCSTLTVLVLILSFLVTPIANLNIFISATSISFTCFFVTGTISSSYTIAGLTTKLYTFPFTLAGNLLLQITLNTLLHPFHPACTLFFTTLSQPPLFALLIPNT